MSLSAPLFTARLIGETEKALNGFLTRALAGTGLTERDWVVLRGSALPDLAGDRAQLAGRLAGVFKVPVHEADAMIGRLVELGMIEPGAGAVTLTPAGRDLYDRVYAATVEVTASLWGDLPAADLETAARMLATLLERANARLG
jgi:DNA-binding MarR family transcriptional regulator